MPSVHIGGTNGKGSVSALVTSALAEAGWRVGLYTSPHLISFRERIQINGVPISEESVAMWTGRLLPAILQRKATFFEATTALAFADFAARKATGRAALASRAFSSPGRAPRGREDTVPL